MSTLPAPRVWVPWVALAVLSAALRLSFATEVGAWQTPPSFDEIGYAARAQGAMNALFGDPEGWRALYGKARWPPLHALALSPGTPWGIPGLRVMSIVLGVAGTLSLTLLGRTVVDARAGWLAGALHAVLPVWLGYGVLLLSEGSFLVSGACTLAAAWACVERRHPGLAWLTGALLGASLLTRATALPWLLAIPWVLGRYAGPGFAARCLAAALCCWAPWSLVASVLQHTWVPGSSLGPYNAWLGAFPAAPTDNGGAWGLPEFKVAAHAAMRDVSAVSLAGSAWLADPLEQLARSVARLAILFTPDFFVGRHALSARWPGLGPAGASAWAGVSLISAWLLPVLGTAAVSRTHGRRREWCLLALLPLLPALFTVAIPRLALTCWTWLIPLAWTARGSTGRAATAGLLAFAMGAVVLPGTLRRHLAPVHGALPTVAEWLPLELRARDRVRLRRSTTRDVTLRATRIRLVGSAPTTTVTWTADTDEIVLEIIDGQGPALLWLDDKPFAPGDYGLRGQWRRTPVEGIEARWPEP